jgi:radical SAM protein with 4Fe4S-binding SPASM domain
MKATKLNGLCNVNIELTNKCNKNCFICGRRKIERDYPELVEEYRDIDFSLLEKIVPQLPDGIVVQLHNNGESLLYPRFGEAVKLFKNQITNVVTNGKLLVEKAAEIIGVLDTIAISVIEDDVEAEEQLEVIKEFLKIKGNKKPVVLLRLNGNVDQTKYKNLKLVIATRALHSPMGSFDYKKNKPVVPEVGICWDFLHHLAINSKGEVSICVRFDPKKAGVIGNVAVHSLDEIWNSNKRLEWLKFHKEGKRHEIPLCSSCHFWGVPVGL